jgi:hypothetical protein
MRHLEYPVLGIPVRFATNSDDIFTIVENAFGGWDCLPPSDRLDAVPMVVRFTIGTTSEDVADANGHCPVAHSCPDADRVVASTHGSFGESDPSRRQVVAVVSPALVADREHFRETFLEALTFALLAAFDRHPIHAAAISNGSRAVLLAGPSGSGKSSLALVARNAGLRILGDDHVWIETVTKFRVWGAPRHIRLLSDKPSDDPRGKAVVRLDEARYDPSSYGADAATVCILARGSQASLARVDETTIVTALTERIDPGFDRFPERHPTVVKQLAAGGGWRLILSENPDDALPFLRVMLD